VRRILTLAALMAGASLAPAPFLGQAWAGDILIHGGPIHTGVAAAPTAQAVLIRDDRIAFVGDLAAARPRPPRTPATST
jgi:glyoxylase-like metal-dependent hydrolase (beta-lactamase superfamily II)